MKTSFLGMELKNPVIIAAGTWNRDGESIKRAFESGAAAVITESVSSDKRNDINPRVIYDGNGFQNIKLYSHIQVEDWQREMAIAKSGGGIVIASITGQSTSEFIYLAEKLEKFGADAIEMCISSPHGETFEIQSANAGYVYEMTNAVVSSVKIPVMVKLSQTATNIADCAKAAKKAGASAVSAINSIRCILGVDINSGKPMLPTYGGYSGAPIRPIGLAAIASIAQSVDVPLCGIGGIGNYENALEYIMLGASAVQIGSAILKDGFGVVSDIIRGLEKWEEERGIKDINEIRGIALNRIKSFDELKTEPIRCIADDRKCIEGCTACISSCIYGAIERLDDNVEIFSDRCSGCGLCTTMCTEKKLKLDW